MKKTIDHGAYLVAHLTCRAEETEREGNDASNLRSSSLTVASTTGWLRGLHRAWHQTPASRTPPHS
jgi:hypothetical protein